MSVGKRIKFFRKEMGYTQSELAEILGVSMQAVSKWETETGMPDVSVIVPLARILNISTDILLGVSDNEGVNEIIELRDQIGNHRVSSFSESEANRVYKLADPFFKKHPTNPEAALWCLESLSVIVKSNNNTLDSQAALKECARYEACIKRYETDPDMIFKSYYILQRCYNALGDCERADEMLKKIPSVFGDRAYWEAEFAYADENYELALQKCKESFAYKARFVSRCIRMARMINDKTDGKDGLYKRLELNEYMLNIINAFLSGGTFLPYRMMYQKFSLLSGMVRQYVALGMENKAVVYMQELLSTRKEYFEFLTRTDKSYHLMFDEKDLDAKELITPKKVNEYANIAFEHIKKMPSLQNTSILADIEKQA